MGIVTIVPIGISGLQRIWGNLAKIKSCIDSRKSLRKLKVARACRTLPHKCQPLVAKHS